MKRSFVIGAVLVSLFSLPLVATPVMAPPTTYWYEYRSYVGSEDRYVTLTDGELPVTYWYQYWMKLRATIMEKWKVYESGQQYCIWKRWDTVTFDMYSRQIDPYDPNPSGYWYHYRVDCYAFILRDGVEKWFYTGSLVNAWIQNPYVYSFSGWSHDHLLVECCSVLWPVDELEAQGVYGSWHVWVEMPDSYVPNFGPSEGATTPDPWW